MRQVAPNFRVGVAVSRTIDGDVETENVIGPESGVGGAHVEEAAHKQTGRDEQHDGARNFSADQQIAHARVRRRAALETCGNLQRRCDRNGERAGDG